MKRETNGLPSPPNPKAWVIESSLRCFVYSLLGLVPLLGIPCALAALVQSRKVRQRAGSDWNPAGGYLKAAGRLAPLGLLTNVGFLVVVLVIIPAVLGGLSSCSSGST